MHAVLRVGSGVWECRGCGSAGRVGHGHCCCHVGHARRVPPCSPLLARNESDMVSWWVTGKKSSFFFFMVYKNTLHGDIKLKKIAGEYKDLPKGCGREGVQAAM